MLSSAKSTKDDGYHIILTPVVFFRADTVLPREEDFEVVSNL